MEEGQSQEYRGLMEEASRRYLHAVSEAARRAHVFRGLLADADEGLAPRGMDYSQPVVQASPDGDGVHRQAARHSRQTERWASDLAECSAVLAEAEACVACMPGDSLRTVVELRYLDGMTWRQTAATMGLAESTCKAMRGPALCALYPSIPQRFRIPRQPAL